MPKELGARAKRNRIANYMDTFPEEFEVLEDNLENDNPEIKLQTKTRIVTLKCSELGKVEESFRMRRGAGSKEEFLVKQEAYNAVRSYYNDYYTGAKIKQSSFDEGYIKLELETKIVTLTYNSKAKIVEEKERARRGTKHQNSDEGKTKLIPKVSADVVRPTKIFEAPEELELELKLKETYPNRKIDTIEKPKRHRRTKAEMQATRETEVKRKEEEDFDPNQTTLDQFYETEFIRGTHDEDFSGYPIKSYERISEGTIVRNIYSKKDFKVVKPSDNNIIEVFDKEHGYLTLARSDVKVMVAIPGAIERNKN